MVKTILFWVFVVIGIIALIQFIELLDSVTKYFKEKKKKVETETLKILEKNNSSPSFDDTDQVFSILNFIIDGEIAFRINLLSYSKTPYNLLNLDKDIQDISNTVFSQLNKEMLQNSNIMVTSDYIMHYIVNQITIRLASSMHEYNVTVSAIGGNNQN